LARGRGGAESRLDVIEDARAGLAVEHFVAAEAAHFLKDVGPDAHAARATFFVANFGEGHAVVFAGDALVMIEQVFGDFRHYGGSFGSKFRERLFGGRLVLFDGRALDANLGFHVLQRGFGLLDAAVVLLAGHHLFEQAIFRFGDLVFGHLHFVLEGLVGFVGFYLGSLVAILADAVFPRFHVELEFFAVFEGRELGGFALLQLRFGGGGSRIGIGAPIASGLKKLRGSFILDPLGVTPMVAIPA